MLSRQPLRRQVLAATAGAVLVILCAILWSGNQTRLERRREIKEQSVALASTVAASFDQYLAALYALASTLSQHEAVRALDPEASHRLFASVIAEQPLLVTIALGDRDGNFVSSNTSSKPETVPRFGFVQEALREDRPVMSDLFNTRSQGVPTAVLAYPVRRADGPVVGVLGLRLDLVRLQEVLRGIPLPTGSVVTVTDRNGRILARSLEPAKYVGLTAVRADSTDAPYIRDLDGVNRLSSDAPLERATWQVSVGIPLAEVLARVSPIWLRNIILLTVVLLLSVGLVLLAAIRSSRGLEALRTGAQRIASGDLTDPPLMAMPNLELHELQSAYVTMAAKLREARDAHEHQVESERRLNEMLHAMQRQVVRQERLAAVGQLVAGVAHELNNPLQAILGASQLLERRPELTAEAVEELTFVQNQAIRARQVIRSLSRFSDTTVGVPEQLQLVDVVEDVVKLRAHDNAGGHLRVSVHASTMRPIFASYTDIARVVLNLVLNAEHALQDARTPAPGIDVHLFEHGGNVRCEVADNGPGVLTSDEPKLFQPFFTTREVGDGAGLGLSVSYGIVQSYGGTIGYHRNRAGGATFYFELPIDRSEHDAEDRTSLLRPSDHTRV